MCTCNIVTMIGKILFILPVIFNFMGLVSPFFKVFCNGMKFHRALCISKGEGEMKPTVIISICMFLYQSVHPSANPSLRPTFKPGLINYFIKRKLGTKVA